MVGTGRRAPKRGILIQERRSHWNSARPASTLSCLDKTGTLTRRRTRRSSRSPRPTASARNDLLRMAAAAERRQRTPARRRRSSMRPASGGLARTGASDVVRIGARARRDRHRARVTGQLVLARQLCAFFSKRPGSAWPACRSRAAHFWPGKDGGQTVQRRSCGRRPLAGSIAIADDVETATACQSQPLRASSPGCES